MQWWRKLVGKKDTPAQTPTPSPAPETPDRLIPLATVEIETSTAPGTFYQDQILRKDWAEGVVTAHGVPVNRHLPVIESEAETRPRTLQQVAERLLALTLVAVKGEGLEQDKLMEIVTERQVLPHFTPAERAFILDPAPDDHTRVQFSWRYEAAWVMYWALHFTDGPLAYPDSICDVPLLVGSVRDERNLARHGLQSTNNLLNEADLIYRYHWAVRQAQIDGAAIPGGLEPGVVMERHHALNWLIGYDDADWDEVSTDT